MYICKQSYTFMPTLPAFRSIFYHNIRPFITFRHYKTAKTENRRMPTDVTELMSNF